MHFTFKTEERTTIAIVVKDIIFFQNVHRIAEHWPWKRGARKAVNMFTCDSQEFRRETVSPASELLSH